LNDPKIYEKPEYKDIRAPTEKEIEDYLANNNNRKGYITQKVNKWHNEVPINKR
jgi:hypothetical protein